MEEGRLRTTPEALRRRFASEQPMRIAIETGTHSPWVNRLLGECAHEVLVANARKLRHIFANKRKTDEIDAENLARLARLDPKLLYPLRHRGEGSQAHMALICSLEALVSSRTQLVNPGYVGRSNPSGLGCPSVLPGASTREPQNTSPRHSGQPWSPSWSRDRLAHRVHPPIQPKAGGDLPRALPRNRSVEAGRGDRGAHSAHLRAHGGRSLPLREEPLGRGVPGARASHRPIGGEGSPKTHLQGGRRDA